MIPRPTHPWLPQKMVLVGLPWVAVLIWPVLDALFAAEKADAALSNPLPKAHQPIVGLLSWTRLRQFLARNARVAAQRAKSATFAVALASEPVARRAAILPVAECDRVLAAKSLPYLQRQGRCLMRQ